jgi:hypothetical protein
MTLTTARPAACGQRTQVNDRTRHARLARLRAARFHGIGRARRAPVLSRGAASMFSLLLLPSYCQTTPNPTEEAMPDPDAGPSHRPGVRTLGGTS